MELLTAQALLCLDSQDMALNSDISSLIQSSATAIDFAPGTLPPAIANPLLLLSLETFLVCPQPQVSQIVGSFIQSVVLPVSPRQRSFSH